MDSQADSGVDYDIDRALEAELDKVAADEGLDPVDPYGGELELIKQFQQNPSPETFAPVYAAHTKLIHGAASRYIGSSLPKAASRGYALQRYTHALQTYDPNKGAQFKTYLFREMQRLGRYKADYSNVAGIPSARGDLINLLQSVEPALSERFGRPPTDIELADEMRLSAEDVASLQKKVAKIKDLPKTVGLLRTEMRPDFTLEEPRPGGGDPSVEDSRFKRVLTFLHGSLSPEQQLIVEHSVEGFGKPIITDDMELAKAINMSPQKVRALKAQVRKKADREW